jgi:branched-chain amino acid transport system permease protein
MIKGLVNSSFGRALKAIRENEVAAEAMGVNLFRHKLLSFVLSGFFAGVAGGLFVTLISTVSPSLFTFTMTFNLLIIIVLGGLGSINRFSNYCFYFCFFTRNFTSSRGSYYYRAWTFPGIPGMRMVVFSVLLVVMMIFYRRGLFGDKEISWQLIIDRIKRKEQKWRIKSSSFL